MGKFASDPDYSVRWPVSVLRSELNRLIMGARDHGETADWKQEVELLLRQAFSSAVPREDFAKLGSGSDYGDEPF